jgi:glutathionyl-hydroquinone reductase
MSHRRFGRIRRSGGHLRSLSGRSREEIDAINARIYPALNNGVYRAGSATAQGAYEEAFDDVFAMLDELEAHLATVGIFWWAAGSPKRMCGSS